MVVSVCKEQTTKEMAYCPRRKDRLAQNPGSATSLMYYSSSLPENSRWGIFKSRMQVERDSCWNSQNPGRFARIAEVIAQLKGSIRVALSEEGWRNSPAMQSNNEKSIASSIERDEISALFYWKPTWSDFMEESKHPCHRYCWRVVQRSR